MAYLHLIREISQEKGITLKELAKQLKVTEAAIQKIINSNSTRIDTLEKIAKILEVSISVFFNRLEYVFEFLKKYKFTKTIDTIGSYSENADLYYIELKKRNYEFVPFIVLIHVNKDLEESYQAFDCWLAFYDDKSNIGLKRPVGLINLFVSASSQHIKIIEHLLEAN